MLLSAAKARRKILFRKAKLAEEAKRYDHMLRFMKEIVEATDPDKDLSPKERCLLGAAFKNFLRVARSSHLSAVAKTRSWLNDFDGPIAASYLLTSKMEICRACAEMVQLIDFRLLPFAVSNESKVFYLTLKGDVSWYMAEVKGALDGMGDAAIANSAYAEAWGMVTKLDSMNPHRLAFAFSVADYLLNFRHSPAEAFAVVDRVLNLQEINSPETSPAVSLLTFEGGLQLTANLLNLRQRLKNELEIKAAGVAGPSNLPAGNAAGNPLTIRSTSESLPK
ncbi:14-3-3-like protein GF14 kappa [Dendrobium catenatum]|uniref:14-3-3-like protein GF14 phi n=1 Tax=Dendrobium catenatum TaxID=906689 RepID=A0A2I0VEC0_9ASPA|nr:14-3-3-like protein GF14 kappa [Dendrobium catenatum]PKU61758.1 14-3-3-like protein GF14 phi [Dendrobium catenatum]